MKKKDVMIVGIILLCALLSLGISRWVLVPSEDAQLRITVDGELYGQYELSKDQIIRINETNACEIKDGKVTMIESNCPDHLCEKQKSIDRRGGTIVCLPNKVVLDIQSKEEPEVDAVT